MPQRKNVVRTSTVEVMGEDSYVLVRKITTAEAREVLELHQTRKASLREKASEKKLPQDLRSVYVEELQAGDAKDALEEALKRYADHIIEWNWVYEDGKTMPLPADDPTVLVALTGDEIRVLAKALGMLAEDDSKDFD